MNGIIDILTGSDEGATQASESPDPTDQRARHVAEQVCAGFQYHDRLQRAEAVDAFHEVDRNQFAHLSDEEARSAAEAFVDALWLKDSVERSSSEAGEVDRDAVSDADWSDVYESFHERAEVVGMDEAYADLTVTAWKRHKSAGEYWTPLLKAQLIEYRKATGWTTYPEKPNEGESGFGPAPMRYVLGVELHDLHHTEAWREAINVMTPYYRSILKAHQGTQPY